MDNQGQIQRIEVNNELIQQIPSYSKLETSAERAKRMKLMRIIRKNPQMRATYRNLFSHAQQNNVESKQQQQKKRNRLAARKSRNNHLETIKQVKKLTQKNRKMELLLQKMTKQNPELLEKYHCQLEQINTQSIVESVESQKNYKMPQQLIEQTPFQRIPNSQDWSKSQFQSISNYLFIFFLGLLCTFCCLALSEEGTETSPSRLLNQIDNCCLNTFSNFIQINGLKYETGLKRYQYDFKKSPIIQMYEIQTIFLNHQIKILEHFIMIEANLLFEQEEPNNQKNSVFIFSFSVTSDEMDKFLFNWEHCFH